MEVHYDASGNATLAVHKRGKSQGAAVQGVGKAKAAAIAWLTSTMPDRVSTSSRGPEQGLVCVRKRLVSQGGGNCNANA